MASLLSLTRRFLAALRTVLIDTDRTDHLFETLNAARRSIAGEPDR